MTAPSHLEIGLSCSRCFYFLPAWETLDRLAAAFTPRDCWR